MTDNTSRPACQIVLDPEDASNIVNTTRERRPTKKARGDLSDSDPGSLRLSVGIFGKKEGKEGFVYCVCVCVVFRLSLSVFVYLPGRFLRVYLSIYLSVHLLSIYLYIMISYLHICLLSN